jgi:hypothetical protein
VDIDSQLKNYLKIIGVTNNTFVPKKTSKNTRTKLYIALALPALSFGCENWTIKARDARRITAAEMKYKRKTAGYIRIDYRKKNRLQIN